VTLTRAVLFLCFAFLISCSDRAPRAASLGDAYVAPTTLNLRRELATKSAVSATVKHSDKLEVLEYRHRFVRVRTAEGVVGWADARQLLTPEQMAGLQHMAETASQYLSQGTATVYETLNVHTEPVRASPSFWQIPENGKVDVIAHRLSPRTQAGEIFTPAPVKPPPARRKAKPQPSTKLAPPPRAPAPKPPNDWLALSVPKNPSPTAPPEAPKQAAPSTVAVPMDDWSLVRNSDGKVGWVLTRPLIMAIPDEVAQYAEGHRITSYFTLGQARDRDAVKNNWLWTTITKGLEPYEFDSFRVFVWSQKHHHYETAYIERNIVGHYPVQVDNSGSVPRFSVVLEGNDGHLYRKTYSFEGFHIRMISRQPYQQTPQLDIPKAAGLRVPEPAPVRLSWYARLKDRFRRLFR
jgi:hypothetical protein